MPTSQAHPQEVEAETEILGKPSSFSAGALEQETIELEAGVPLHEAPDRRASVVLTLDAPAELPLLKRRQGWAQVRYGSRKGWVPEDSDAPDLGVSGRGARAGSPDPERLARARALLGDDRLESGLGAWHLITDVADPELLAGLAVTAGDVVAAYRRRFGLDPGPSQGEAVVLFAAEDDYRRFEREVSRIGGLGTLGHTSGGLVVSFAGDRSPDAIRQILVHELTHVLNGRSIDRDLPPWLEEGLADDLAFSGFDRDGRLVLGSLGGESRVEGDTGGSRRGPNYHLVDLVGPHGALFGLLSQWKAPERPELVALVELPWAEFVQPDRRRIYYAESAFFVRFLLDGLRGGLADAFRSYLAHLASGETGEGTSVWDYLGVVGLEVEEPFYLWLRAQAMANGVPLPSD